MDDSALMQRALELAEASVGLASPNPQVGCVLTLGGRVIGEGAHYYAARDHAEIVVLKQAAAAGRSTKGASAYVTLEPCSHHGRTGPCADALIAAGIAKCFVATMDPNPAVAGRGIARLRAAGIEVQVGLEQGRARRLNEAFALSIVQHRPFVHLKSGLSVDGRLAPLERVAGTPHWLTGPAARAEVQRLRHGVDAIVTGIGTVLADDPLLTDRSGLPRRRPLLRIVLDPDLRIPMDSKLVESCADDLWIFCTEEAERTKPDKYYGFESRAMLTSLSGPRHFDLQTVLRHIEEIGESLAEQKVLSLLLEAGPTLNAAFLHADLVDRATLFYAPTELGPASLPFAAGGPTPFALEERMTGLTKESFGDDVCVSGLLRDPWE